MNDVLDEIIAFLSTGMAERVKTFYKGEVVLPPKSYLPALMVFGNSTNIVAKSTAKDQYIYNITVRIVMNINKKFSEDGTGTTIKAYEDMVNIMEDRETTGVLMTDTVLGLLRENVKGTNYLFNNTISVEYGKLDVGEYWAYKAEATFEAVTDLILRP